MPQSLRRLDIGEDHRVTIDLALVSRISRATSPGVSHWAYFRVPEGAAAAAGLSPLVELHPLCGSSTTLAKEGLAKVPRQQLQ